MPDGVCRVCSVEVKGQRTLCAACAYPVSEGMEVMTHTPKVREARRMIVELMLANHPQECLTCAKNQKCELQKLAKELGIQEVRFKGERKIYDDGRLQLIGHSRPGEVHPVRAVRADLRRDPERRRRCTPANRGWNTIIVAGHGR